VRKDPPLRSCPLHAKIFKVPSAKSFGGHPIAKHERTDEVESAHEQGMCQSHVINSLFHAEITSVSNRSSVLQAAVLDMLA
jgi:hypothetical protein